MAVDDDTSILRVMEMRLQSKGYRVISTSTGFEALALAQMTPIALAVIDCILQGEGGIMLMQKLREVRTVLPVIILTACGTIGKAVDAMNRGSCSYLTEPFDGEDLVRQIESCLEKITPGLERVSLAAQPEAFSEVIFRSGVMKSGLEKVVQVACTDSNVYIEGEKGGAVKGSPFNSWLRQKSLFWRLAKKVLPAGPSAWRTVVGAGVLSSPGWRVVATHVVFQAEVGCPSADSLGTAAAMMMPAARKMDKIRIVFLLFRIYDFDFP